MLVARLLLAFLPFALGFTPSTSEASAPEHQAWLEHSESPHSASPLSLEENRGLAAGKRAGMPFTKKGKAVVKQRNASENDGKNRCENCGVETVPAKQHEKNVTPPANEAHVDHVVPKAKGGEGEPDNGQVLCRDCNIKKSDNLP